MNIDFTTVILKINKSQWSGSPRGHDGPKGSCKKIMTTLFQVKQKYNP